MEKAKKFLSSLGESPTAEYDRQALANGEIQTDQQKAFAHADYGSWSQGGQFGSRN